MKVLKLIVLIGIVLSIIVISVNTFAIDDPSYYNPGGLEGKDAKVTGEVTGKILGIVRVIGIIISVIVISIIGIKYMICSVSEKATFKENLIPYTVGVILLAATTILPATIYNMFGKQNVRVTQLAPPASGFICPECKQDMGEIPAGVIMGGRYYFCQNCQKNVKPQNGS